MSKKGIATFLVGVTAGYLYRKYGLKPNVHFYWCEERPRYFMSKYRGYFKTSEDAYEALTDLECIVCEYQVVKVSDLADAIVTNNGVIYKDFNVDTIYVWTSMKTARVRKRRIFETDAYGDWILEIAENPHHLKRIAAGTNYYDGSWRYWSEKRKSAADSDTSGEVDEEGDSDVSDEEEVD